MSKTCLICNKSVPHLKKHYKKEHPLAFIKRFKWRAIDKFWNMEDFEDLSTEHIIQILQEFEVDFRLDQFLEDVKKFYAAEDLADYWHEIYPITATGLDEDFIWLAAVILWERLAPDVISSEQIDAMMQAGYDSLEIRNVKEACTTWLEVWDLLKTRFTPAMKTLNDAEQVFSGMQCLFNWCQDLEMELWNAGLEDPSFYQKRITYCQEFCSFFPESDIRLLQGMKRSAAESSFALGLIQQGEAAFQQLIDEFPDYAWGYITWGDMYYIFHCNENIPLDDKKAEQIYQMALNNNVDDIDAVLDRLEDLKKRKNSKKV
ncbi:MAG: SEC-C metal-binding domain-containing protein [Candidatus Helarchaeota archaeon]